MFAYIFFTTTLVKLAFISKINELRNELANTEAIAHEFPLFSLILSSYNPETLLKVMITKLMN